MGKGMTPKQQSLGQLRQATRAAMDGYLADMTDKRFQVYYKSLQDLFELFAVNEKSDLSVQRQTHLRVDVEVWTTFEPLVEATRTAMDDYLADMTDERFQAYYKSLQDLFAATEEKLIQIS